MDFEIKRGIKQHLIKSVTLILIFIALIFLSAGDWRWGDGWLYIGLLILNFILAGIILFLKQPALLARRGQAGAGT